MISIINRENVRVLKNLHPGLYWASLISLICAVLPFTYSLVSFEWKYKLLGVLFLTPFIITILISYAAVKLFKYIPNLSRALSFALNIFVILFIQICLGLLFFYILMLADLDAKCNQIKHYKLALSNIDLSNTFHFPREIPKGAKNVKLKAGVAYWSGEDLYLKFDTNKEYIDKELKKYNFIKICDYSKCRDGSINWHNYYDNDIVTTDFTFYVLGDRMYSGSSKHYAPCHYGIGVNYDTNQILYYYENSD